MIPVSGLSELEIITGLQDDRAVATVLIDGVDILALQRPSRAPDGSLYPNGPMTFIPPDPAALLPPDSAALLPTAAGTTAMIGVCTCGEAGDASLWMRVRRSGDVVVWEPEPDPPRSSIDRRWKFELHQYLDAIDTAQSSMTRWEPRARRIARELRRRRDSLFGFPMSDVRDGTPIYLLDARPATGPNQILLVVTANRAVHEVEVEVGADLSDHQVVKRLRALNLTD